MLTLKNEIVKQLISQLEVKINSLQLAIASIKESRDNETKSSVGDKYETGREMAQRELEKNKAQLAKTQKLKIEISNINTETVYNTVEFGSLVVTNQHNYFISAALGKVEIARKVIYCISLASPVGKVLHHCKKGDLLVFQQKEIQILSII